MSVKAGQAHTGRSNVARAPHPADSLGLASPQSTQHAASSASPLSPGGVPRGDLSSNRTANGDSEPDREELPPSTVPMRVVVPGPGGEPLCVGVDESNDSRHLAAALMR